MIALECTNALKTTLLDFLFWNPPENIGGVLKAG